MVHRILVVGASAALLVACSVNRTEREYGESVRQMINAQVYNPSTLTAPSDKPVEGADPYMVTGAVDAMREHVSAPAEVGRELLLQVGNGGR